MHHKSDAIYIYISRAVGNSFSLRHLAHRVAWPSQHVERFAGTIFTLCSSAKIPRNTPILENSFNVFYTHHLEMNIL